MSKPHCRDCGSTEIYCSEEGIESSVEDAGGQTKVDKTEVYRNLKIATAEELQPFSNAEL